MDTFTTKYSTFIRVFNINTNSISLELLSIKKGQDFVIIISGGESEHIGAVTLSTPRPSLKDASKVSASTSVLTAIGHKEDILARNVSEKISGKLNCKTSVICGIHIDDIKEIQFNHILLGVDDLVEQFLDFYAKEAEFDYTDPCLKNH